MKNDFCFAESRLLLGSSFTPCILLNEFLLESYLQEKCSYGYCVRYPKVIK